MKKICYLVLILLGFLRAADLPFDLNEVSRVLYKECLRLEANQLNRYYYTSALYYTLTNDQQNAQKVMNSISFLDMEMETWLNKYIENLHAHLNRYVYINDKIQFVWEENQATYRKIEEQRAECKGIRNNIK